MQSPYETLFAFDEEKEENVSQVFTDIIRPHKYLLNFDDESHTIFFSDKNNNLWTNSQPSLAGVLTSKDIKMEEISDEEFNNINNRRSIVFYFPERYNIYILARFLGVSKVNDITKQIDEIDSIYIYLGMDEPYVVFNDGDKHFKIYDLNLNTEEIKSRVNEIEQSGEYTYYYPMRETQNVDNDIYLPYKMSKTIPIVYVKNELNTDNINDIRRIAEEFFEREIDYIREIVEDNGSVLYLYKDRVLKIYQSGLLEYFAPLDEEVHERNLYISLNTASEFLSTYMDIPENLYLSKIEEIEAGKCLGYRFTFKYRIRGFPVILKNSEVEGFIQIDVFNKQVRYYKRFIREDMNIKNYNVVDTSKMLSAFDIINMNYELLKADYIRNNKLSDAELDEENLMQGILSSIDDISISYLDPCQKVEKERLIGVWVLQIGDNIYAFDVYKGNLVLKKRQ